MEETASWEAYRVEFFFFNSSRNRWQAFQESFGKNNRQLLWPKELGSPEQLYRDQIQGLLYTVREALSIAFHNHKKKITGSPRFTLLNPDQLGNTSVQIHTGKIIDSLERIGGTRHDVADFCQEVRDRYREEGLPSDESVSLLLQTIKSRSRQSITINRDAALNLLICLPYLRHWDIVGAIDPFGSGNLKHLAGKPVFSYCIHYPRNPNLPPESIQEVLGYDAKLSTASRWEKKEKAAYNKLAKEQGLTPVDDDEIYRERTIQYFDECHSPQSRKERIWYSLYAHLMDRIQVGLAGGEENVTGGDELDAISAHGEGIPDTYCLAFPLRVCGWDHYLVIYFRANGSSLTTRPPSELLDHWFTNITALSSGVDLKIFKESLREFIVQIRIAAFQGYVSRTLMTERSPKPSRRKQILNKAKRLFCMHAHNLVRLNWIQCDDCRFDYSAEDLFLPWRPSELQSAVSNRHIATIILKGRRAKEIDVDLTTFSMEIPWEAHYSQSCEGILDPFFRETSRQRLDEQLSWLIRRVENRHRINELWDRV